MLELIDLELVDLVQNEEILVGDFENDILGEELVIKMYSIFKMVVDVLKGARLHVDEAVTAGEEREGLDEVPFPDLE